MQVCIECGRETDYDTATQNVLTFFELGGLCPKCAAKHEIPSPLVIRGLVSAEFVTRAVQPFFMAFHVWPPPYQPPEPTPDDEPDEDDEPPVRRRAMRIALPRRYVLMRLAPKLWNDDRKARMIAAWNGRCAYCDTLLGNNMHTDHYIPVSAGWLCPGEVPWNLLPACPRCNWMKRAHMPIPWIKSRFPDEAEGIIERIETYFASVTPSRSDRRAAMRQPKQLSFDLD